jgi:hypothetical protein
VLRIQIDQRGIAPPMRIRIAAAGAAEPFTFERLLTAWSDVGKIGRYGSIDARTSAFARSNRRIMRESIPDVLSFGRFSS